MKAVADCYSLHRNPSLDFINGKPKKAVEHLVSVIRPATLKTLIESKLDIDKSELKKDFLEFVKYLEQMAIIHDKHCHVVEHKKTGNSGMKNTNEGSEAGSRSSGHISGGSAYGVGTNEASDRDRTKTGHGRSSDSTGLESSRPGSRRLASTRRSVRARSTTCPTVFALKRTKAIVLLSGYKKTRDADNNKANFKTLGNNGATADKRDGQTTYLTAENLGVKVTVLEDTGSDYSTIPNSAVEDARKRGFPLKVEVLWSPSC
jgi:hypothetical protein